MTGLGVTCGSICGLRSIVLENRLLRVVVLPEAGARIWQITYKPLNADILWHNSKLAPAAHPLGTVYDDNWSGGWDDLFPNDEGGFLAGLKLPDHGELWTGNWTATTEQSDDSIGVNLSYRTPITHFLAERCLRLRDDSPVLEVGYRLTNESSRDLPFLWKLHPAFAVSSDHRIDFPPMIAIREMDFQGTLESAPPVFEWPLVKTNDGIIDMRNVPDVSSRALHFFYGTEYSEGWCGVTNCATGLAAALYFDRKVFSSCWLFASHGGWNDLNVAVLEPATGYPFRIQSMIEAGRARTLAPGESLETTVLLSVQEGLKSIGGVASDGRILPSDEN
jgi:hypothetical protein